MAQTAFLFVGLQKFTCSVVQKDRHTHTAQFYRALRRYFFCNAVCARNAVFLAVYG